jgi:hypothetical protein
MIHSYIFISIFVYSYIYISIYRNFQTNALPEFAPVEDPIQSGNKRFRSDTIEDGIYVYVCICIDVFTCELMNIYMCLCI